MSRPPNTEKASAATASVSPARAGTTPDRQSATPSRTSPTSHNSAIPVVTITGHDVVTGPSQSNTSGSRRAITGSRNASA
jgi:hypothetical protein